MLRFLDALGIYLYDVAMTNPVCWAEDWGDPLLYANVHAFFAELTWPTEPFAFFWARVALQDALEEDRSADTSAVRDAWVIGAAQYILRHAAVIYAESVKTRKPEPVSISLAAKIKAFFARFKKRAQEDDPEFTWERWRVWKSGFRATAEDDTYGQTCRNVAERAADLMALQEKAGNESVES